MKILKFLLFFVVTLTTYTKVIQRKSNKIENKQRQLVDEAQIIQTLYDNRSQAEEQPQQLPQFYKKSMKQRNLRLKNISKKYFANEKKWLDQQQQKVRLSKQQKKRILEENEQLERIINKNKFKIRKERQLTQNKLPGEKQNEDDQNTAKSQTNLQIQTQQAKKDNQKPQKIILKKLKTKHTIHSLYLKIRRNFQGLAGLYNHKLVDNPQFLQRVKDDPEGSLKITLHYIKNTNDLMEYYIKNFILTTEVIDAYDKYSENNNNPNYGTQDDMLKFYVAHNDLIKIRKYEKNLYKIFQQIYQILQDSSDDILALCNSNTTKTIFKEDMNNFITLIQFIQKYFVYLKSISLNHFHHLDFDKEINKYRNVAVHMDTQHYQISHKNFKQDINQKQEVPVQIMFQDIDEYDQNINQNDPDLYVQQKLQRIPDDSNQKQELNYDNELLEQQKLDDQKIIDQNKNSNISPLTNKTGTIQENQNNKNELTQDNINFRNQNKDPFDNFDSQLEKAKVDYALNNHHQNIEQLKSYKINNKQFNTNIPMKEVYGLNYTDEQLDDQVNKDSEINYDQNLKDENIVIVKTPEIIKKDLRLSPITKYDGYGEDVRLRQSDIKKFQDKKTVDQYQEMYNTFRNSTQVPFQEIKTHLDASSNLQRSLIDQKLFTPPKGYQLKLPLRNDLAYLLQDNAKIKTVDKVRKLLPQLSDGDKSLFDGDKKDKWERKADKVYRELLKI